MIAVIDPSQQMLPSIRAVEPSSEIPSNMTTSQLYADSAHNPHRDFVLKREDVRHIPIIGFCENYRAGLEVRNLYAEPQMVP
ncbi:hypothetical protein EBB79_22580 (plasmid) [Parasedimentitalea marina]|uniref:Uncharacterized protein n=1 Tax=Parasedimentitalea marina TaxID=2483033 RepID=A0A3T0N9P5_9RHOB|nr:hypothetical protein EBB79_22580 [Parasedimentitalea marina]